MAAPAPSSPLCPSGGWPWPGPERLPGRGSGGPASQGQALGPRCWVSWGGVPPTLSLCGHGTSGSGGPRQDSAPVTVQVQSVSCPDCPSCVEWTPHTPRLSTRRQLCFDVQLFIKDVAPLSVFPRQFIFGAVAHGDRLLGINSALQGGGGADSVFLRCTRFPLWERGGGSPRSVGPWMGFPDVTGPLEGGGTPRRHRVPRQGQGFPEVSRFAGRCWAGLCTVEGSGPGRP